MAIKLEPTYTEQEVSRILRESEGQLAEGEEPGGDGGHAEERHELIARGRNREHTTIGAMRDRMVSGRRPPRAVGAFQNCQAKAIAFAFNTKAGQTALSWLCMDACFFVFAEFDIAAGGFRMIGFDRARLEPPVSGATWVVGPGGLPMPGIPVPAIGLAGGVAMKLMKAPGKTLHIRTAFPLVNAPAPPTAELHWHAGGALEQELPI